MNYCILFLITTNSLGILLETFETCSVFQQYGMTKSNRVHQNKRDSCAYEANLFSRINVVEGTVWVGRIVEEVVERRGAAWGETRRRRHDSTTPSLTLICRQIDNVINPPHQLTWQPYLDPTNI